MTTESDICRVLMLKPDELKQRDALYLSKMLMDVNTVSRWEDWAQVYGKPMPTTHELHRLHKFATRVLMYTSMLNVILKDQPGKAVPMDVPIGKADALAKMILASCRLFAAAIPMDYLEMREHLIDYKWYLNHYLGETKSISGWDVMVRRTYMSLVNDDLHQLTWI